MWTFSCHITDEETKSLDFGYLFKVTLLVSSEAGIWMQDLNTFWDVTGLKRSQLRCFPGTASTYLKNGKEKKPNQQPVCHCKNSDLTKSQDPNEKAMEKEGPILPMTLLSWKGCS